MPIYGKKRKRVGQTNKPKSLPSTGGVLRGSKRKRVGQTGQTVPGKPAPMPTRPKKLKPTEAGGVYRGHKVIKRVPKKKKTPGGPRVSNNTYTVGK